MAALTRWGAKKASEVVILTSLHQVLPFRDLLQDCIGERFRSRSSELASLVPLTAFSGRTSATNSCRPAWRASEERWRKSALPIPWP
jgi:hypothetical protein